MAYPIGKQGTEYTIHSSVTSIGEGAFSGCENLISVTIPSSVTSIGDDAFSGCENLTSVTIPNSVKYLSGFSYCRNLTSVEIPNGVVSIGHGAFSGCTSLTSVTIPSSVVSIGGSAFGWSGLTSVTIPNSVISIGESAFSGTGITSVTIPESVTSIGRGAFSGLTSLTIFSEVIGDGWFNGHSLTSVTIGNSVKDIGNEAFQGLHSLTSVTIGDNVTSIGNRAFSGCVNLESLTIPNKVTTIGDMAFYACSSLTFTSLTIPNSVTSIGNSAFLNCVNLTSVTIGASVTTIGDRAFGYCRNLTFVTSFAVNPPVADGAFYNSYGYESIPSTACLYVPQASVDAYSGWGFQCIQAISSPLTYTVTFNPNSGTVSPTSGTTGADGKLASLPTPTRTGYTFNGWYTAATGGAAVTKDSVFSKDTTLYAQWTLNTYKVTFNANGGTVNRVSDTTGVDGKLASPLPTPTKTGHTFDGWFTAETGGTAVTANTAFGANATIYAQWTLITYTVTFNANSGTVSPTSGTTGDGWKLASLPTPTKTGYTFNGWYTAKTGGTAVTAGTVFSANAVIYAKWTPPAWDCGAVEGTVACTLDDDGTFTVSGSGAMADYRGAAVYAAPRSLYKRAGSAAAADNGGGLSAPWYDLRGDITGIVIEDGVTSVGDGAFYGCAAVTSVTIGGDVASIGTGAFSECAALTYVIIGDNVTSIGESAFYNCAALTNITYLSEAPPSVAASTFSGVDVASVSVRVPASAVGAYNAANAGTGFGSVQGNGTVSVSFAGRVVPSAKPDEGAAVIAPVVILSGGFTAGPNPISKTSGIVNFYRQGRRVANSELRIYDATGNVIGKV